MHRRKQKLDSIAQSQVWTASLPTLSLSHAHSLSLSLSLSSLSLSPPSLSVASSAMADHQLRTWVDTDRHDAAIFELPNARSRTKVRSVGRMTESGGRGGGEGSQEASGGSTNGRPSVTFHMGEAE